MLNIKQIIASSRLGGYYAGVGARATPPEILDLMKDIAIKLANKGMILRSGGAEGADAAFLSGAREAKGKYAIYIPWNGFNGFSAHTDDEFKMGEIILVKDANCVNAARNVAKQNHPSYGALSSGSRKLMIRNSYQVFGSALSSLSNYVLCWTKDGADGTKILTSKDSGGTGQAIRIAAANGVPVLNLANLEVRKEWINFLTSPS